jgi:glycosyltransferase involved in cell wall biosynthesis
VATPALKELFEVRGCRNIHVLPNAMNPHDYPMDIDLAPHPDEVRILWQGGSSHWVDLAPLKHAIDRVMKKYKHVKMYFMGSLEFEWIYKDIPPSQLRLLKWVKGNVGYRTRLSTIYHDINICPLANVEFNKYKSAIKWYESSFIRYPAATLAADMPPYEEICDGKSGLLYEPDSEEHFEEQLCRLIEDATLRKKLANNAKAWVTANRDYIHVIKPWVKWVKKTRQEARFGL